jgi:uncharacterized protein YbjT (DUF2867 family)
MTGALGVFGDLVSMKTETRLLSCLLRLAFVVMGVVMTVQGASAQVDGHAVLVFGGTGKLGARIVRLLLDEGRDVAVFVRPTSDRSGLDGLDVDYVVGDVADADSVQAALAATRPRVVIVAVRAPISEAGFYDAMTRHLVAAAEAAGTEQLIYHGAVGAGDNMKLHPDVPWDSIPGLADRMRDHGVAEANLLNSNLQVTIIRNSQVWPDRIAATGQAKLTEDVSVLMPITRADLAVLTMQCLDNPACAGKIYHAADPSLVGKPRPTE